MSTNFTRLQDIISQQLSVETNKIRPESNFIKELGADSLDVVELVMLIEDEFEIEIDDQVASQIGTVQDALNYIESRGIKQQNL